MENKIFLKKVLEKKITELKKNKIKIVQCHGVFDLIHIGHIKHFAFAKKQGDFLVVSITSDRFVNKGPGRPLFNQFYRAEFLSTIQYIDAIYINDFASAESAINIIKPDIFIKGNDYKKLSDDKTKKIKLEINAVKKNNGKIVFSNDITSSSSKLINNFSDIFNNEQKAFLKLIKKKYSPKFILNLIEKLKKIKVMLIGEVIIDEYIFGDVLGKSGKEPHLVMEKNEQNIYLGGSGAIANHLSDFCKSIKLLTIIGDKKDNYNFIKSSLKKNISIKYFLKKNSPTIIKTRFIDQVSKNKLLGVYKINDSVIQKNQEKKIKSFIKKNKDNVDQIIVADYGHGFLTNEISKYINSIKIFKSINAQVNASNIGYQSLNKYKKIPLLIINENELRHELRDKKSKVENLAIILVKKFQIDDLVVTRGRNGSFIINKKLKISYCPAFANKIIDKVGSGDAMFSMISLCKKANIPNDLTILFGSFAAATSVETIGNGFYLDKKYFLKQLEYALMNKFT
jgi:rfaE bifunctional protein kinase chain/domain